MIDECMAGNIDTVITKSISRFARNTIDCLKYIRLLKDKNIAVWFEKESINTMDSKGEVLITIMASLAQQESQSLSQNVKLGLQYRYQQGTVQVNHNHFLGYTKDSDGHLVIDPEQAEVVKRIYREYLEGLSMKKIAEGLEQDGILTGAGKTKWYDSTINKILQNEKYMGDALLQKTVTTDFLTKKRVRNTGTLPQYYVEDDHKTIIPKEIFMQVQAELVRRRKVHTGPNGQKRIYSGNNCFSQMVVCGECGELYRRVHWNNHGCKSIVWRCSCSRLEPSRAAMNCTSRTVKEDLLQEVTVNELIRKANSKQGYDAIADEIFTLREQKSQAEADTRSREETQKRIAELQDFIGSQQSEITEFDESLVRKLIQQITVYDDRFTVRFKSGLEIDINE